MSTYTKTNKFPILSNNIIIKLISNFDDKVFFSPLICSLISVLRESKTDCHPKLSSFCVIVIPLTHAHAHAPARKLA